MLVRSSWVVIVKYNPSPSPALSQVARIKEDAHVFSFLDWRTVVIFLLFVLCVVARPGGFIVQ